MNTCDAFWNMCGPKSGGLSGEHIQLCAEGARRKPNLSGKWTEMLNSMTMYIIPDSPAGLSFLFDNIRN